MRQHLHAHPEAGFEEVATSALVAERLAACGIAVTRGVGKTGVVGTLRQGTSRRAVGLRADMDALKMMEQNEFAHRSRHAGLFHGCGHDGHTAMLLLAAECLAADPSFNGSVHLIFQPAEEGLGGAKAMIEDGLFDRFPCDAVFGLHNWPGIPAGNFAARGGPFLAASDSFEITVSGKGGHAAFPDLANNPITAATALADALLDLQRRAARDGRATLLAITQIHSGTADNVIPAQAWLRGGVRNRSTAEQDDFEHAIRSTAEEIAAVHGTPIDVSYKSNCPVLMNSEPETAISLAAACAVTGAAHVDVAAPFTNGSEDFAFMLQARPGCYVMLGAGDGPFCHHPRYDFNDELLPHGASYWLELVKRLLGPDR